MKTKVRSTLSSSVVCSVAAIAVTAFLASGCGKAVSDPTHPANSNADMLKPGTPNGVPAALKEHVNTAKDYQNGTDVITVAARYVSIKEDASDTNAPTEEEAKTLMANISAVWAQCNINIVLDDYQAPIASERGLLYNPPNQSDLDAMRSAYDDGKHALYVASGKWDRQNGNLGNDGSNGWSTVPPMKPSGTVLEQPVAKNTLLVSHETGHLIGGLQHVTGSDQLMNHFVGPQNTKLSQSECKEARATLQKNNMAWIR
ncbi:MAG: hypothetical protein HY074_00970 [Deltaproteobacteria bacterium]|nr:hypothetical protein [Deltaproteobacteria bacterium]